MLKLFLLSLIFAAFAQAPGQPACDSLFYVPENLKDNVEFWETIYQKIPGDRGLIHDQDTFRVIYDTLYASALQGRAHIRAVRKKEMEVADVLKRMAAADTSAWDEKMRSYAAKWGRPLRNDELLAAASRVRYQLGQQDHFLAGLSRSGRYLDQIKEIFRSYGLPEELAYLPHVESSFNYRAYSKAGAAGIWQFMRGTGRLFLKMGYVIDERLDPMKATHAAAKLLRSNYGKLKSWPLAITAYNHGVNSMERAVDQTGTTDIGVIIDQYQTRTFQFASKNFYASFLAAYKTAVNYKEYFGDVAIEPPFNYMEYPLAKSYRTSTLVDALNLPAKTLQDYNLDIRPTIFKTSQYLPKDYVLKLPVEFTETRLDSIFGAIPVKVALETPPQTGYHKVEAGENLLRIAAMYQVSLNDILSLNNLSPRTCIYPGQVIAIPGQAGASSAAMAAAPASAPKPAEIQLALAVPPKINDASAKRKDTLKAAAAPAPPQPKPDMAPAKPVALPVILLAGKVRPCPSAADSLQFLWTYLYQADLALSLEGVRKCEFCEFNADYYDLDFENETENEVSVKVQIDETLGHFAEWAGISSASIRSLNHISSSIYLGEVIALPISGQAAEAFRKARIEYHMGIEEDFFNNYEVTGMDTVRVKSGANAWTLCQEADIPLWLFLKSNPDIQDLKAIQLGAILVPQVEEK
jgi:membrane-bound lytic murein transglycosylase D